MPDLRRDLPGPAERAARLQRSLNARPIPPLPRQHRGRTPIPVRARVVWERDGVEYLDSVAIDWVDRAVLVHVRDDRHLTQGVLLDIDDVRRRAGEVARPARGSK